MRVLVVTDALSALVSRVFFTYLCHQSSVVGVDCVLKVVSQCFLHVEVLLSLCCIIGSALLVCLVKCLLFRMFVSLSQVLLLLVLRQFLVQVVTVGLDASLVMNALFFLLHFSHISLPLDDGRPLINVAVTIRRVVSTVLVTKLVNLVKFLVNRLLHPVGSELQRINLQRYQTNDHTN